MQKSLLQKTWLGAIILLFAGTVGYGGWMLNNTYSEDEQILLEDSGEGEGQDSATPTPTNAGTGSREECDARTQHTRCPVSEYGFLEVERSIDFGGEEAWWGGQNDVYWRSAEGERVHIFSHGDIFCPPGGENMLLYEVGQSTQSPFLHIFWECYGQRGYFWSIAKQETIATYSQGGLDATIESGEEEYTIQASVDESGLTISRQDDSSFATGRLRIVDFLLNGEPQKLLPEPIESEYLQEFQELGWPDAYLPNFSGNPVLSPDLSSLTFFYGDEGRFLFNLIGGSLEYEAK